MLAVAGDASVDVQAFACSKPTELTTPCTKATGPVVIAAAGRSRGTYTLGNGQVPLFKGVLALTATESTRVN